MKLVLLAGGTGAAKLIRGLMAMIDPDAITVIGNTGDDFDCWGLHISPDLDTVTYALAGVLDHAKGWGIKGDSFRCLGAMAELGAPTWFNIGDQDLAIHVYRSERLAAGATLARVTDEIRRKLGVRVEIIPMSNDRVRTRIKTPDGWLSFQEFFVREKHQVEVLDVAYEGADRALPAPGLVEAIATATCVIVCPSNPVTSIGPILALPWISAALRATTASIVAVSPIVSGAPVRGPAGALMAAIGLPVSPVGVARHYQEWLDVMVIDRQDVSLSSEIDELGIECVTADTLMTDRAKEIALARQLLEVIDK
jgi:LPPG:FO 2-phospho-L-lactate transferase